LGSAKHRSGFALCGILLHHIWGRGHLLRKVLFPAPNVSYLERYALCQNIFEKLILTKHFKCKINEKQFFGG